MEDEYGDLYTFGGVLEYEMIEESVPGGAVLDDEENGKLYLDDVPELDEIMNKKGGNANSVKPEEFLKFINHLAKLEK